MEHIIVKAASLKKYYNIGSQTVKALDGVTFHVKEGEFVSIIGKSGCGKSTLLHMIGGLDTPTSGTVIVDGMNLSEMNQEQLALFRRRKAGFIFQQYNLIPDLTVYDNIIFPLKLDGAQIDAELVQELLVSLHMTDKAEMFPSMLSGGEQQRTAIARALAAKPSVILADEPTGNLDTSASHDVIGLLKIMAEKYRQTLIVITHDLDIAQMADRIIQLQNGKILEGSDFHAGK
ncbi:MAG: ABC transporter ATP-binding protein [Lachnospiraceae bacterium]|nr:ABC transporter ATP-binding protein [Lachnospiraceae bacterium]